MEYTSRITCDPSILVGKPIIKGTRVSVELILKLLSQGILSNEILAEYPDLKTEDVLAAIAYARDMVASEEIGHFAAIPTAL